MFKKRNTERVTAVDNLLFKKAPKNKDKFYYPTTGTISGDVIFMNDFASISSHACSVCWDIPAPVHREKQYEYLARRIKTGHTSVLEHNNIVMYMHCTLDMESIHQLFDIINYIKYLNIKIKQEVNTTKDFNILIGGPIRGYYFLLDALLDAGIEKNNDVNKFLLYIVSLLKIYMPKEMFMTYIDAGIFSEEDFLDNRSKVRLFTEENCNIEDLMYVENIDNFNYIKNQISTIHPRSINPFSDEELLDMATVTILFKDMSRIITQQLTRHRNGITQESERYVNYTDMKFNSPVKFRPDIYDEVHKYKIVFDGKESYLTLQELGDAIADIYPQLIDKEIVYPLLKEDARGFLPQNIQSRKVYMTFTYRTLFAFFNLRTDKHAQAEIRKYATILLDWWDNYAISNMPVNIPYNKTYLIPKCIRVDQEDLNDIEEVIEVKEIIVKEEEKA